MSEPPQGDRDMLSTLIGVTEELSQVTDLDSVLDRILSEARRLTHADAGSVFLVDGGKLVFSYVHNDSLFNADQGTKHLYDHFALDISDASIAGYAAQTGMQVVVDDAYALPGDVPYGFNRSFDETSHYRTKSILALPLKTRRGKVVGVLQVINALDEAGRPVPFSKRHRLYVDYFASHAASAIERALLTREMVLRMIRMAELRDPKETGAHVNRVGAYSAELYRKWAFDNGVAPDEIKKTKDLMRIAAMLHDVGKVAISDQILKKPAKLTPEEFEVIKHHTIFGARLFEDAASDLDLISAEIALSHHERWDGAGYPGRIESLRSPTVGMGPGKKGEEIPVHGRIVALADVYDALISRRSYKEPWSEDRVLTTIQEEAGRQFDPALVNVFLSIYDVIVAIREKYVAE